MDLTPEQRRRIVTLHQDAKMSQRAISRKIGIPLTTVNRTIHNFDKTGTTQSSKLGRCGRKRKSSLQHDRLILRASMRNPRLSSMDIKRQLPSDLSSQTIRRRLLEGGRKAIKPVKKPLLTKAMRKKRFAWAKVYRHWTEAQWNKVIFSDESSVEVQVSQPRVVRKGAEPLSPLHVAQRVKQPQKVMIWGCMSVHGCGRIHVVEGTMRSDQYISVLQRRLIPQANQWYGEQSTDFVFQQDNAPCHTSKAVKRFTEQCGIEVLPWPSNSPDMNPIETLWGVIKARLRRHTLTSKQELINKLLEICARDGELRDKLNETCGKLIRGMPERVMSLYKAKGGHTKY